MPRPTLLLLSFALCVSACASHRQKPTQTAVTASKAAPAEVVTTPTAEAPKPAAKPKVQVRPPVLHARNTAVSHWLDTVAARNKKIKLAKGYRIQVYAGQDRATAMAAKEALYRHYPTTEAYMTYTPPSFRLVCGDYLSRLEALMAARALAEHFPAPLIIPAQVRLR